MKIALISTYEMGRQPFGLASPAAWLREAGFDVSCHDLSIQPLDQGLVCSAELIALYVPMHTATRIASSVLERVRVLNPSAHICAYGLYAPMNTSFLEKCGVETILGGEFEEGLVRLARRLRDRTEDGSRNKGRPEFQASAPNGHRAGRVATEVSLARQQFVRPDRSGLPSLSKYAHIELADGTTRIAGYTEASRGCKYFCRHCPVVPVYNGQFRIVQREVVLQDIAQQIESGATHITFGDPDFFNGPKHALDIVRAFHDLFPDVTYDVTIKIEHILKQRQHLATLRDTGCIFVTSAVESLDDSVLQILDKGHSRQDVFTAVELCDAAGIAISPTFVAFNPWIDLEGYEHLLGTIARLGLIENVAPVQLALRLLIPSGSYLLKVPVIADIVGPFDEERLYYPWKHRDPRVDELQRGIESLVAMLTRQRASRREIFVQVWDRVLSMRETPGESIPDITRIPNRAAIPYLNEPWYC